MCLHLAWRPFVCASCFRQSARLPKKHRRQEGAIAQAHRFFCTGTSIGAEIVSGRSRASRLDDAISAPLCIFFFEGLSRQFFHREPEAELKLRHCHRWPQSNEWRLLSDHIFSCYLYDLVYSYVFRIVQKSKAIYVGSKCISPQKTQFHIRMYAN